MMIMTISTTKKQKWPKIIFLGTIINKILASGRGMVRGKMSLFVAFFVHFDKLIRPHPGPLWGGWLTRYWLFGVMTLMIISIDDDDDNDAEC